MSWLFSQALVEEYLGDICLDGEPSAPLSGNLTQLAYLPQDKMTDFSRVSRFGMTFRPLTADRGEELLTSYLAAFHAKTFPQPERAQELTESDQECGEKWQGSFTKYDQDSCSWKTHQCSLLGGLEPFLETWPRWGLMRGGECWEQPMSAHRINVIEFGLEEEKKCFIAKSVDTNLKQEELQNLDVQNVNQRNQKLLKWPTPRSCSAMAATITPESAWADNRFPNLETMVGRRMWLTPKASDTSNGEKSETFVKRMGDRGIHCFQSLPSQVGGKLNPMWVEWLMGWPLGWTDLKPLEMDKYRLWQQQHGKI